METTAARTGTSTSTGATNTPEIKQRYDQNYALHLKHLLLKGAGAYARCAKHRGWSLIR